MRKHSKRQREGKKTVIWSQDVKDTSPGRGSIRLFKKPKKSVCGDDDRLWKRIRNYLKQDDWVSALEQYFKIVSVNETKLREFFIKKGSYLYSVIMMIPLDNYRQFILNKIPRDCAIQMLREKDFEVLKQFINMQSVIERNGNYTSEEQGFRIKVFTFFLKIDYEGIRDFIEKNQNADFMNSSIKSEYKDALQLLEAEVESQSFHP